MSFISIAEYAQLHGRNPRTVQQKCIRGGFKTAKKIGRNWVIDSEEPYGDNRRGPKTSLGTRICRQCGKTFQGGPRAWYCPECREERKKEAGRRHKRIGTQRPLGSVDHCVKCGKEYVVTAARQKYCPDCAAKAIAEVDRRQALERYATVKDAYNPVRYEKRRVKQKFCVRCGKPIPAKSKYCPDCLKIVRGEQLKIAKAKWITKNRGKVNAAKKLYYKKNIEKVRAYQREWKRKKRLEERNKK